MESTIPSITDGEDVLYVSKERTCEVLSPNHPPVLFDYLALATSGGNVPPRSGEVFIKEEERRGFFFVLN